MNLLVKICKILSQNFKIFRSKIGCPSHQLTLSDVGFPFDLIPFNQAYGVSSNVIVTDRSTLHDICWE